MCQRAPISGVEAPEGKTVMARWEKGLSGRWRRMVVVCILKRADSLARRGANQAGEKAASSFAGARGTQGLENET